MGISMNPRKKIDIWASIVMEGYAPRMLIEESLQHCIFSSIP